MKKILALLIIINLFSPIPSRAQTSLPAPADAAVVRSGETATISWKNPDDPQFLETVLFRSTIPIGNYFSYEAVDPLCDKLYAGREETFTDSGLAINLPYYYILFTRDRSGSTSDAVVLEKLPTDKTTGGQAGTLAGATSAIVNNVTLNEAEIIYNYNGTAADLNADKNTQRLALFIIVKSPHDLSDKDKNSISYFIQAGTPTTILLGTGERAGVLNSYLSVFSKLPRSILEWQDVLKIANGRWPDERSVASEDRAANQFFSAIYERKPDMGNPNDSAAITVIAYGLRPGMRNMKSEKAAIKIFENIFRNSPTSAVDWDIVRAIAYSGATR